MDDFDLANEAPFTLSTPVFDAMKRREVLTPLIPKGTALPAVKDLTIAYSADYQQAVRFHLYSGEGPEIDAARVEMIAEVIAVPPADDPPGTPIRFEIRLDSRAEVSVVAVSARSGKDLPCTMIRQKRSEVTVEKLMRKKAVIESQLKMLEARISSSFLVFISAKSADYQYALRIYEFLISKGVSTFFSQQLLPALANSDYRKEIDQALDQAQNLIVVTSTLENVMSPWVEAEWGLFINEKRSGRKSGNLVTVVVGDLKPADLPASLRYYEVLPFGDDVFEAILRYIRH